MSVTPSQSSHIDHLPPLPYVLSYWPKSVFSAFNFVLDSDLLPVNLLTELSAALPLAGASIHLDLSLIPTSPHITVLPLPSTTSSIPQQYQADPEIIPVHIEWVNDCLKLGCVLPLNRYLASRPELPRFTLDRPEAEGLTASLHSAPDPPVQPDGVEIQREGQDHLEVEGWAGPARDYDVKEGDAPNEFSLGRMLLRTVPYIDWRDIKRKDFEREFTNKYEEVFHLKPYSVKCALEKHRTELQKLSEDFHRGKRSKPYSYRLRAKAKAREE